MKPKLFPILFSITLLMMLVTPVLAVSYNPGVASGQYVKYGNFVGTGPGAESFNDYDWLELMVTSVSGKDVTLLSTSQYKNGTAIPGNGSTTIWNIETGTENGVPSAQGPIIAANLNQGDVIPPPNTYSVNRTESRAYFGIIRTVNILDVSLSTPDYNTTLIYVYDQASGMLLESNIQTTTRAQPEPVTTTVFYSIMETNIFTSSSPTPSPIASTFPLLLLGIVLVIAVAIVVGALIFRRRKNNYIKKQLCLYTTVASIG